MYIGNYTYLNSHLNICTTTGLMEQLSKEENTLYIFTCVDKTNRATRQGHPGDSTRGLGLSPGDPRATLGPLFTSHLSSCKVSARQ